MNNLHTFRNTKFVKRDYECTNVIACVSEVAPNENYVLAEDRELAGLTRLWTENGVTYYGYL